VLHGKKRLFSIGWEGLLFRVPLAELDGTLCLPFGVFRVPLAVKISMKVEG
jgi:hypothetical protein